MTLVEAEKIIYEEIKAGKNYRDIAKMSFPIDSKIRRFNPSQIHKIKEKYEPNIIPVNRDSDKALAFKKMKEGISDDEIVIQTELPFEYVRNARQEYLECLDKVEVPKSVIKNLFEHVNPYSGCKNFNELEKGVKLAVEAAWELERFYPPCLECDVPMIFCNQDWNGAIRWLQENHQCDNSSCQNY